MVAQDTRFDPQVAWELLERMIGMRPEDRAAVIDAPTVDPATRSFVIEILDRTRASDLGGVAASSPTPEIHARYRLLARIGEGGFGEVFLGRSMRPPKRLVAVKVLRNGLDGPRILRRFES